jgi:hypothetical protein
LTLERVLSYRGYELTKKAQFLDHAFKRISEPGVTKYLRLLCNVRGYLFTNRSVVPRILKVLLNNR